MHARFARHSPKDLLLLHTLSTKVKLLQFEQCCALSWPSNDSGLRSCHSQVRSLEMEGLVTLELGVAAIREQRPAPVATWRPGETPPDLHAAHRRAMALWSHATRDTRSVRYIQATEAGAALVGGATSVVRPSELSHDLLLSSVYLATRWSNPRTAEQWEGEAMASLRNEGQGRYDATIRKAGGPVMVEVIGASYTLDALIAIHDDCAREGREYQMW